MKVTFDSNAWEPLLASDEARLHCKLEFDQIRKAIESGRIKARIPDSFAKLEAIRKYKSNSKPTLWGEPPNSRAKYFLGSRINFIEGKASRNVDGGISLSVQIEPDIAEHGGICANQRRKLERAAKLGFQLLAMGRLGLGVPTLPPMPYAEGSLEAEAFWQRQEIMSTILTEMRERKVGDYQYFEQKSDLLSKLKDYARAGRGLWPFLLDMEPARLKRFDRTVSEMADGDTVATHIAYRNDLLCTEDRGRNSKKSVFDEENREWLRTAYNVKFVSVSELASLVERQFGNLA
jgi:hypothetical protein